MLGSLDEVPPGSELSCDICIVGAGPAGIVLGLELSKQFDVIVLDAGGTEVTAQSQQPYRGSATGTIIDDAYLTTSRLSALGGTSNHWAGWCLPFAPHDFSPRPWISESAEGWPLTFDELRGYYRAAAGWMEVPAWPQRDNTESVVAPFAGRSDLRAKDFHISPPTRFGTKYAPQIKDARRLRCFLHAVVCEFDAEREELTAVRGLRLKGRDLAERRIRCDRVVLAGGAIENARLLLASHVLRPRLAGLPWLARGFSDHAEVSVGIAIVPRSTIDVARSTLGSYTDLEVPSLRMHFPTATALAAERLPNFALQITPIPRERCPEDVQEYAAVRRSLLAEEMELLHLRIRLECPSRLSNGLQLLPETDVYGRPRVQLRWELTHSDLDALRKASRFVARALVETHNAALRLLLPESQPWQHAQYASHHIGMTRMGRDAVTSVVDEHCKLRTVDNVFLAGSSVFYSASVSSPTPTILALALRLADHLKGAYVNYEHH